MNDGIEYYKILFADVMEMSDKDKVIILSDLKSLEKELNSINMDILVEPEQVLDIAV